MKRPTIPVSPQAILAPSTELLLGPEIATLTFGNTIEHQGQETLVVSASVCLPKSGAVELATTILNFYNSHPDQEEQPIGWKM